MTQRVVGTFVDMGFLRHGETGRRGFRGESDDPLTPAGLRRMARAARRDGPWDAVATSPLRRCADFARRYASSRGLPLRVDARWRELSFGKWEGLTVARVHRLWPAALGRFWRRPDRVAPPGGESFRSLDRRARAAVRDLFLEFPGRRVLVVTHGGVVRALLRRACAGPKPHLLSIPVARGSLRVVRVRARGIG